MTADNSSGANQASTVIATVTVVSRITRPSSWPSIRRGALPVTDPFIFDPVAITVHDMTHLYHFDRDNVVAIRRALQNSALSDAWREPLEKLLN